ncbi:MAG: dihydroneopterin aldolase [Gammaproteobacteria bacterium]|nr:dihydroneopterin aldolase [Gammaproteobacteria bacterium]
MDIVFIKELCIETVIGIYDWERKIKQVVCIDLELGTEIKQASESENIEYTVDYKAVAKKTKALIQESEFFLIETLAEETIKMIFRDFNITHVKGRFSKPGAVTGSKEVGVIIERNRDDS